MPDHGRAALLLYGVALVDMAASSLTFALTPGRVIELGGDAKTIGLLSGFVGALQLVAGPLVGRYSDRLADRRWVLILGLLASALGSAVASLAADPMTFFLSRVPAGLFAHTLNQLRAACADIDEGTAGGAGGNAQHFAHINSAVGIGLAIGSGFGGQLSYASASGLASVAYVVAATMVLIGLPAVQSSSRTARKAAPQQTSRGSRARKADGSASPAPEARTTLSMGVLAVMVVMRLLFSSCATAQRETFALAVKDRMNMSEGWIGAFLSYKGVVAMLANSVGLVPLLASKRWPSHVVLLAATGGLATSYSLSAMALHTSSSALLAVTQMPLTVTTNVCRTLLQAVPLAAVPPNQRGEILGWFGAVDAGAKVLAPIGASWVLHLAGATATLLTCATGAALLCVLAAVSGTLLGSGASQQTGGEKDKQA